MNKQKKFNVSDINKICKNYHYFHINMLTADLLFQVFLLNQNNNFLQNEKKFLYQFIFLKINNFV